MPLDPKQQPPYYTPGTLNGPPITNVAVQHTVIATVDTTLIPAAQYTMPANTMNTDGDVLLMKYFGATFNAPTLAQVTVNILGNTGQVFSTTPFADLNWDIEIMVIRGTTNTAYFNIRWLTAGTGTIDLAGGSLGSINWTIPHAMQLAIQAPTDGNIRCTAGYTQLIKS